MPDTDQELLRNAVASFAVVQRQLIAALATPGTDILRVATAMAADLD